MSATSQLRPEHIQAALAGPLQPVRTTLPYQLAIALVAVCMLLLPFVYLGLVGLLGYALLWHASENLALFETMRSAKGALVMYMTPLVVGGTLLAFMIKPLFAPRPAEPELVSVTREEQPELFLLVERLCALVGAPVPCRIDVNCDVNASAGFRHGLWSLFTNELVLTIGLPLVSGLTLRQLTGVLAHEFGHFAQGSGMRVSYVIRSVNGWFARVVYGRDRWDQWLTQASENGDFRLRLVFYVARFFVWSTRLLLTGLMYVGHTLSCFLLRQMEFDADRYEARIAGSQVFGQTARTLPLLSAAHAGAMADLSASWHDRQLTDDFLPVVMHNFMQLPKEALASLERHIQEAKTGVFDTHPCDRERIASAEAERCEGLFQLELPARTLFRDFELLSKRCSLALYQGELELTIPAQSLVPSEAFLAQQRERDEEHKALRALLGRPLDTERALRLDPAVLRAPSEPAADRALLRAARDRIALVREKALLRFEQAAEQHNRWVNGLQAEALLRAGLRLDANSFGLANGDVESAQRLAGEARRQRFDAPELHELDGAVADYVSVGLRAAHALALPESAEVEEWVHGHQALHAERERTDALEREFFSQVGLLNNLEGNQEVAGLREAVLSRSRALVSQLMQLRDALRPLPYPFEHAEEGVSFGHALVSDLPADSEDIGAVMRATSRTLQRVEQVRSRLLARLLRVALAAERALETEAPADAAAQRASA